MKKILRMFLALGAVIILATSNMTSITAHYVPGEGHSHGYIHHHDDNCDHDEELTLLFRDRQSLDRLARYSESSVRVVGGIIHDNDTMSARAMTQAELEAIMGSMQFTASLELFEDDEILIIPLQNMCCDRMVLATWRHEWHSPTPGICVVTTVTTVQCQRCGALHSQTTSNRSCFDRH